MTRNKSISVVLMGLMVLVAVSVLVGQAHADAVWPASSPLTTTFTVTSPDYLRSINETLDIDSGGTLDIVSSNAGYGSFIQDNTTGTTTININTGGAIVGPTVGGWAGQFIVGNAAPGVPGVIGIINLNGGTFTGNTMHQLILGRIAGEGYFNISAGTATFLPPYFGVDGSLNPSTDGAIGIIDFTAGSTGTLTITGEDQAYYEGLYAAGNLTYAGSNTNDFSTVFTVSGETISVVLTIANTPDPFNEEDTVEIDLLGRDVAGQLSWAAPAEYGSAIYDVYFGTTEPNATETDYGLTKLTTTAQSGTSIAPTLPLTNDTLYYWVVDSYEPNAAAPSGYDLHPGAPWSFTTVSAVPAFTLHPSSVLRGAAVGNTEAVFEVAAINATSYQWYKDGVAIAGEVGTTLEITGVTIGDEAEYTCMASNSEYDTLSDPATLEFAREKLYLDFEGNLTDQGDGYPTTWLGDTTETYVTDGYLGQAIAIDVNTDPNSAISVDPNAMPKTGLGISVSVWIKNYDDEGDLQNTALCEAKSDDLSTRTLGLYVPWSSSVIYFDAGFDSYDDSRIYKAVDFAELQNTWNYFVFTKDVVSAEMKIYRNGVLWHSGTDKTQHIVSSGVLLIGSDVAGNGVTGLMDDFRLYNYAISAEEVATLYEAATGIYSCLYPPAVDIANGVTGLVQGDEGFVGDCIVNLYDFAAIADVWLDSGLYPVNP